MNCLQCNNIFENKRATAKFCSSTCRSLFRYHKLACNNKDLSVQEKNVSVQKKRVSVTPDVTHKVSVTPDNIDKIIKKAKTTILRAEAEQHIGIIGIGPEIKKLKHKPFDFCPKHKSFFHTCGC